MTTLCLLACLTGTLHYLRARRRVARRVIPADNPLLALDDGPA